jgi:hypothetical protein
LPSQLWQRDRPLHHPDIGLSEAQEMVGGKKGVPTNHDLGVNINLLRYRKIHAVDKLGLAESIEDNVVVQIYSGEVSYEL